MMLGNGTNAKIVSEILGHSCTKTTLDVYSHILPDIQASAIDLFEKKLFDV
jgi:integrase